MFLLASGEYVPERIVDNEYFSRLTGRSVEWFETRTGIRARRRAAAHENTNSMGVAAVANLLASDPHALTGIDLIVGASYTPWDTIGTIAHAVQRQFGLKKTKALYVSTACSSFTDALELTAAYFDSRRASKALIIAAEHNSLYANDADEKSGHLWGDGAAACVLAKQSRPGALAILDIVTQGLADRGFGPEAITMAPRNGGLVMSHGRDIFTQACHEMAASTRDLLRRHEISIDQVRLFIAHQANKRIIDHVIEDLGLPPERAALTIVDLGNTGCASVPITLHRARGRLARGELGILVTFGGGYSAGSVLLRAE
jgi:3-oxoacyl-[acyl-carrier-protein] synthase-3